MRLKKLEIFGFKSFADKTQVIFDQGVTCIVGPNGCGKSNISDSIRWVLGERSAKMLRGSKMEDVIFAGTEFRKPLAIAEVALTIDNTDKGLPIDFQEVTITRRLYRSGESEYFINKTICRLKDIQDLILDTGMGSSSYSMIEQGRIDYILNAEPEERRSLIEEAAGIAKYKTKKDEAIRKLEKTEENRLRLNDIVLEVQKNIQYAERQAKRAQRYQEQLEKLKNLEIRKAFFDLALLDQEENKLTEAEQNQHKEMLELETRLEQVRAEQNQLNEILAGILDRYSEEESKRHRIQSKRDQNEQQLRFHHERRMEMASRRGQIQQENFQMDERLAKNELDLETKHREITSFEEFRVQLKEALAEAEIQMKEIDGRVKKAKSYLDQVKHEAFETASETSKSRNEFHRVVAFLESGEHHKKRQEQSTQRLREEKAQWLEKHEEYENNILKIEASLSDLVKERERLQGRYDHFQLTMDESRQFMDGFEKTFHEKETTVKMLAGIQEQQEANEQNFLESIDGTLRTLVHPLREIFTVQSGFEWALEAALDAFSKSLVAENLDAASRLLAAIREQKSSSLGIVIRDLEAAATETAFDRPEHPFIQCALQDVIQIHEGYNSIFDSFFVNTYLLRSNPDTGTLKELWPFSNRYKFLAPDGTAYGPFGRIYYRKGDLSSEYHSFQRKGEIQNLHNSLADIRRSLDETSAKIASDEAQLHLTEENLTQIDSQILDAKIQKESFDSHKKGIRDRLSALEREIQLIAYEGEELNLQFAKAKEEKERLEVRLEETENKEKQIRVSQENVGKELEQIEHEKAENLRHLTEIRTKYQHLEEQVHLLLHSLKLLEEHRGHDQQRREDLTLELAQLDQKEKNLVEEDAAIRIDQEELEKVHRASEVALELIRREKESAEQTLTKARESYQVLQSQNQELQNALHQFEMKKMEIGYQKKNINERLFQAYKIRLADYSSELFQMQAPAEEAAAQIQELRDKVESIGTVNLLAIEEYEELKQRYDFLQNQMKDLEQARDALLETIRQINRTTKTLFHDTFLSVQLAFQEYYQLLFGGGVARLTLTDESNPLESGIDIFVRPPGKKLQNIRLLSGGEKALTAIALLFALFKIKPSPFCVLDEVDAPLDEANIDRFLNVLKSFLTLSQFIIVTHNRKTIAMGDALYGVTMEEAGISKLVSVKVSADQEPKLHDAVTQQDQTQAEEPVTN